MRQDESADAGLRNRGIVSLSNGNGPHIKFEPHYRRLWAYVVFFTASVSVTPLVIMTVVNHYQYDKMLTAEMLYPIAQITSTSSRFMADFLEEHSAALAYVVRRESYEDLCDEEQLRRILLDMNKSFGGFVDLGVIDPDGNQRSYVGRYELEGLNYKEQDWFHEVSTRGAHVSDVFMGHRDLPHFVIAARKDYGNELDFFILRATIDSEVLGRHIALMDLRPSSDAFLINREGVLQTPSRHGGDILEQCPIPTPPFSAKTEVLEMTNRQGEPRIVGYAYIDKSPFVFVVLHRAEDRTRSWLHLRSEILWLLGISTALMLTFAVWGSTYLVNRIRESDVRRNKAIHDIAYTNKMASIGRMAAGVAHEINNPLAIINENAGLLKDLLSMKEEPPEKERVLGIADTVIASVERCSKITHRLLGFAKRMDPVTERIALGPLLEEVLSFQGKETDYRSITVDLSVPANMPTINSDRGQLQQVFLNILSNAYAAVNDGGRIDISLEAVDDNTVAVRICDNGAGIPEKHIHRIFEPFFSTKGEYGTGLGLSITFGIVEKLGGQIEVQSEVGKGAVFTVRLPVTQED